MLFKNILVVGGNGFVGSHFIRHWFEHHSSPSSPAVIINLNSPNAPDSRLPLPPQSCLSVVGKIEDEEFIKSLFVSADIDTVVNFLDEPEPPFSLSSTYNLIEAARWYWARHREGFHDKLFIQGSTVRVYGSNDQSIRAFTETSPLNPLNPYAASKAAEDLFSSAYSQSYGLPIITVRPSHLFGPAQILGVVPEVIKNIINGKITRVYNGNRDWLYIDDFIEALDFIMFAGSPKEVYNISTAFELTSETVIKQVVRDYCSLTNKDVNTVKIQSDQIPAGKEFAYPLTSMKLRQLGWKSRYTGKDNKERFDRDLYETVNWFAQNKY